MIRMYRLRPSNLLMNTIPRCSRPYKRELCGHSLCSLVVLFFLVVFVHPRTNYRLNLFPQCKILGAKILTIFDTAKDLSINLIFFCFLFFLYIIHFQCFLPILFESFRIFSLIRSHDTIQSFYVFFIGIDYYTVS